MKHDRDVLAIKGAAFVATLIAFLTVLSASLIAQRAPGSPRPVRTIERREIRKTKQEAGMLDQESQLRALGKTNEKEAANDMVRRRAIVEQVKQDFDRLQVVNGEIRRVVTANTAFDYKNLTEMTSEIRKRAKRLKEVINLPPPDESQVNQKKLDQISHEGMKAALLVLHDRIVSFVTNPLFYTPNWIDIKLGAKASLDLKTIIELSGTIKKNAERLNKPTQ